MITYLLEVTGCWAVFYGIYHLLLRVETFHCTNRWYLLTTLLLGLAIPALDIDLVSAEESPTYLLQPITVGVQQLEAIVVTASRRQQSIDFQLVALWTYWLGVAFSLARFGYGLWQIGRLYHRSEVRPANGYRFVTTTAPHLPFSFFRNLFWSKNFETNDEDRRSIVRHEEAHIFQRHSHDVVLLELVTAFAWCIPFVYFYKKAIKTTHEYLADAYVTAGFDKKQYGRLLLRQSHPGMQVAISNSLFSSQLKKRIVMMTKTKSSQRATLKYLAAMPAVAVLLMAFSFRNSPLPSPSEVFENQSVAIPEQPDAALELNLAVADTVPPIKDGEEVFKVVEEMPRFPGCEDVAAAERNQCAQTKLMEFIFNNIKYPAEAKEKGIEGTVFVKFIVETDGSIADAEIARNVEGGCGEEVLRLVYTMPKWIPAKQDGKAVRAQFALPVKFKLDAAPATPLPSGSTEEVFQLVEEPPRFPGCEDITDASERAKCAEQKLFEFIFQHVKYPSEAREKGIEGTAFVKFIVEKDGTITGAEIARNVEGGCGEEVRRIVGLMPKWIPGKQRGRTVRVQFNLPVKFKLDEGEKAKLPNADSKADKPELLSLNIFPNPTSGKFTVSYDVRTTAVLRIADATGKELARLPLKATNGKEDYEVSMKGLPKGMLYVTLLDNASNLLGTRILMVE